MPGGAVGLLMQPQHTQEWGAVLYQHVVGIFQLRCTLWDHHCICGPSLTKTSTMSCEKVTLMILYHGSKGTCGSKCITSSAQFTERGKSSGERQTRHSRGIWTGTTSLTMVLYQTDHHLLPQFEWEVGVFWVPHYQPSQQETISKFLLMQPQRTSIPGEQEMLQSPPPVSLDPDAWLSSGETGLN